MLNATLTVNRPLGLEFVKVEDLNVGTEFETCRHVWMFIKAVKDGIFTSVSMEIKSDAFNIFKCTLYRFVLMAAICTNPYLRTPKIRFQCPKEGSFFYKWQYQVDESNLYVLVRSPMPYLRESRSMVKKGAIQPHANIVQNATTHYLHSKALLFWKLELDSSQITQEAKYAMHIQRLDPDLNQNIGKIL